MSSDELECPVGGERCGGASYHFCRLQRDGFILCFFSDPNEKKQGRVNGHIFHSGVVGEC